METLKSREKRYSMLDGSLIFGIYSFTSIPNDNLPPNAQANRSLRYRAFLKKYRKNDCFYIRWGFIGRHVQKGIILDIIFLEKVHNSGLKLSMLSISF